MKTYYHFTNDTLRNGKPIPPIGEWLTIEGKLIPCIWGLHASEHPYDASKYAPGTLLHKVELDGEIIPHNNDKVVARKRKIIATIDTEKLCRDFARKVALDVIHLWKAPEVVKKYLETGDEDIREKARDAAAYAYYSYYVWAACCAARCAASYARSADVVAYCAAAGGDVSKYRQWFLEMVEEAFQTNVSKS